jgi:hypothetical protein
VLATSEDVFEVVAADSMGNLQFLAYTCAGKRISLEYPLAAGRAYFGPRRDGGYDPCRGPFTPVPFLSSLPADTLSGVAVRLSDLRRHGMSGTGTDVTLLGKDALTDPLVSFRRVGEDYPNEPFSDWGLPVPGEEMAAILRVLAGTPEQRPFPVADPCLSVRVMATLEEPPRVSELLFDRDQATDVIEQLREVVYDDEAQRFFLDRFACVGDFIPLRGPRDVTDSVMVEFGPYRSEPGSRVWSTITVTNLSLNSLPAPLSLVLASPYGQKIAEPPPNGMACRGEGPPRVFYDLDIGDGLAPGDSVEFRFALEMRYNQKVSLAAKLLSGSGVR